MAEGAIRAVAFAPRLIGSAPMGAQRDEQAARHRDALGVTALVDAVVLYVALAARLQIPLLTLDARLSCAPGLTCAVELVT